MKRKIRGVGVGTISLVMIFAVLCLTVFSMLTLSSANAEKILADKTAAFVSGYYTADSRAAGIMAQVSDSYTAGIFPSEIDGVAISYEQSGGATLAAYSCQIDDVQELVVKLRLENGGANVLEWKAGYAESWEADDTITVWGGDFESDETTGGQ